MYYCINGIELKKGYFPNLFNIPSKQNYVAVYPDVRFYNPDLMNERDREKFFVWYGKQNGIFNLQTELLENCKSDVKVHFLLQFFPFFCFLSKFKFIRKCFFNT